VGIEWKGLCHGVYLFHRLDLHFNCASALGVYLDVMQRQISSFWTEGTLHTFAESGLAFTRPRMPTTDSTGVCESFRNAQSSIGDEAFRLTNICVVP
jgi:hypothetical protein